MEKKGKKPTIRVDREVKDPYRNKITYAVKWDTEESLDYKEKLLKYFGYCSCMSDCPPGWSQEVYRLIKRIDETYGIEKGFGCHTMWGWLIDHPGDILKAIGYWLHNTLMMPAVRMCQIKEKFGTLRVYYDLTGRLKDEYLRDRIDKMIREVEIELAIKGAYYPLEYLAESSSKTWPYISIMRERGYEMDSKSRKWKRGK